jgi:hypothetical protein
MDNMLQILMKAPLGSSNEAYFYESFLRNEWIKPLTTTKSQVKIVFIVVIG